MTTTDMISILKNVSGDARGLKAEDILLTLYRQAIKDKFWKIFYQTLIVLWNNHHEADNDYALGGSCGFCRAASSR